MTDVQSQPAYIRAVSDSALHLRTSPAAVLPQRLAGRDKLPRTYSPGRAVSGESAGGCVSRFWKEEGMY